MKVILKSKAVRTTAIATAAIVAMIFIVLHFFRKDPLPITAIPIDLDKPIAKIMDFAFIPDKENALVMLGKSGKVAFYQISNNNGIQNGEFRVKSISTASNCGAFSLVFDPEFIHNRYFYILHCNGNNNIQISRFTYSEDVKKIAETEKSVYQLQDDKLGTTFFGLGPLLFTKSGTLLVFTNDQNIIGASQNLENRYGKILHLRATDTSRSSFLPDSPTSIKNERGLPEIYASGLSAPWTAAFDSSEKLWIGDRNPVIRNQNIHVLTKIGQDFSITKPRFSWNQNSDALLLHGNGEKAKNRLRVPLVGLQYAPEKEDQYEGLLLGQMIVGDWCTGWVGTLPIDNPDSDAPPALIASLEGIMKIAKGKDDMLYLVTFTSTSPSHCFKKKDVNTDKPELLNGGLWQLVLRTSL